MRLWRPSWPLLAATLATACGGPTRPATLELSGFVEAGEGYHYEAWLEGEDETVSIHRFDGSEAVIQLEIEEEIVKLANSSVAHFFVTLQPSSVSEPSVHTVVREGFRWNVEGYEYQSKAIPFDAWYEAGCCPPSYQVSTPTTSTQDDEALGIWWFGFDIQPYRALGPHWVFEGWVITAEGRFSTGRFRDQQPDDDGAGPGAGPEPGYDAPGQDFIDPPLSLHGARVEVTVEPEPDNSPEPFAFMRWGTDFPADANTGPNTALPFGYGADVRQPTATLSIPYVEE